MNLRDSMKLNARECWLPFAQQFALSNDWDICGDDIEDFVDGAMPYLSAVTDTTLEGAKQVLTNYYQDAPLIRLLLHSRSHQSDGVWSDLTGQYVTALRRAGLGSEVQTVPVAQIQDQFRAMLAEHTYQAPLWIVLAAFVQSMEIQYAKTTLITIGGSGNDCAE